MWYVCGYSYKRLIEENNKLKELQSSVKILANTLKSKELSDNESKGLLTIISQFAYALDILDQYDYQKIETVCYTTNTGVRELLITL